MQRLILTVCLFLLLLPSWLMGQEAAPQPLAIRPSGAAYLDAIRFRGIEADVAYYDPTRAVPPLDAGRDPVPVPKPDAAEEPMTVSRFLVILLAAALLTGIAVLVARNAGSFTLSLQGDAQNAERLRRTGRQGAPQQATDLADFRTILTMTDRRQALVALAQATLARTVSASGVILQASWTLRDALTHVPQGQDHSDALRHLVLAGERVLFGNRDVTEAEFQAHVAAIRPLIAGGPA